MICSQPTVKTNVDPLRSNAKMPLSQVDKLSQCTLQWRQQQLWVTPSTSTRSLSLPALQNPALMTDCLKQSAVKLVVLDPALGTETIQIWLKTCAAARKRAVLRVPSNHKKVSKGDRLLPWLKQMPGHLLSLLMVAMLSPFVLGIRLLLQITPLLSSSRWQRALSGSR